MLPAKNAVKKTLWLLRRPVAKGARELAEQLGCTVGTLKGYLNRLFAKLGVVSREELMAQLL